MIQEKSSNIAVVIGGGIAGLAAAALLAKQGWEVRLFEKNNELGGRAGVLRKNGFQFDRGPSWYLMPEIFDQFFALFGKRTSDFYSLVRLNPRYKVFFGEEKEAVLSDDIHENAKWFDSIEPGAGKKLLRYLLRSREAYQSVLPLLFENVWNTRGFLKKENLNHIRRILINLPLWKSWHSYLSAFFQSDVLQKVLGFPAVFLGGSPFNIPAIYSILNWADFGGGVWYPNGGMNQVVRALENIARHQGVKINVGANVTKIIVNQGKAVAVEANEKVYAASVVVAATDIATTETTLLNTQDQTYSTEYWQKKNFGISALLLYLGVHKRLEGLAHHNIYFSKDWGKNFDDIFKRGQLPSDPSFYISVRSVTDRSIVPKNSEELFVLVPLASRANYSDEELRLYSEKIVDKLERLNGEPFRESIVVRETFTPKDFEKRFNAYGGTALGLAHTFGQSLWLRPSYKTKVSGLYYAGQYANPGIGIPMALISAQIVAQLVGEVSANKIFKNGSTTYYYSSLFFNGQVKRDVFSLYAYVRVIDDLIDVKQPSKTELERFWKETKNAWNGKTAANIVVANFVELAKRKAFEWSWIQSFWMAMRSDLKKRRYRNYEELEKYMYGSAEVIGYMMARILDLPKQAMITAGIQGKAMQFVNFIRDVKEDEQLGRKYLSYTPRQRNNPIEWEKFLRSQIKQYWRLQREAEKGYQYIPRKYRIPIKTAADMYGWTAEQIYEDPSVIFQKKIKPTKYRVLLQLCKNSLI